MTEIALCDIDECEELARYVETGDGHAIHNPKRRCHNHQPAGGLWRDLVVAAGDLHRGAGQ